MQTKKASNGGGGTPNHPNHQSTTAAAMIANWVYSHGRCVVMSARFTTCSYANQLYGIRRPAMMTVDQRNSDTPPATLAAYGVIGELSHCGTVCCVTYSNAMALMPVMTIISIFVQKKMLE